MTTTIATNRATFVAQLNATITASNVLSASVVHAVRNVIDQNGNPQSLGYVLAGLEEASYKVRSPKNYQTIINFINSFVGCVKVKEEDGSFKLTDNGDFALKKSEKRLTKIFEAHKIDGFKDGISGAELAPLMAQLGTKLDEYLETRERGDDLDDDELPSIFAGAKDTRTDEEKEEDKKKKAEETKAKNRQQWNDGGKEKHATKAKDMGESFLGYIAAVCKAFGHTENELIEMLAAKDAE